MAEIVPFKGILYNPEKVDISSVMSPPYDIVTSEYKETLYNRSPYNIIRIDFGMDNKEDNEKENRYTRASRWLNEWLKLEILTKDTEPSFYCYEISYKINSEEKKLRGFLSAVRIEDLNSGKIHPHEMTYSKPKTDRLNILRFCNANISPVFSLYSSQERVTSSILENISKEKALIEARNGDGFIHRLWRINDKTSINAIKKEMSDKDIFIADGHHRYETALEFRNEMNEKGLLKTGDEPFNYVMMFLANIEDDGLTVLPTHRLAQLGKDVEIRKLLSKYFDIVTIKFNSFSEEARARHEMFRAMKNSKNSFGMFIEGEKAFHILRLKDPDAAIDSPPVLKGIDVTVLHNLIFRKLLNINRFEYEMDPEVVIEKVKKGLFRVAFFLNPTRIHDVKEVAIRGERMPPKSTYFYPKLLTGMVIYKF